MFRRASTLVIPLARRLVYEALSYLVCLRISTLDSYGGLLQPCQACLTMALIHFWAATPRTLYEDSITAALGTTGPQISFMDVLPHVGARHVVISYLRSEIDRRCSCLRHLVSRCYQDAHDAKTSRPVITIEWPSAHYYLLQYFRAIT